MYKFNSLPPLLSEKAHRTFALLLLAGSDYRAASRMMYRSLLSLTLLASASSYTLNTLRVGSQSRHAEAVMAADTMGVRDDLRNIAIVAHVDHGKTTLVDAMLESAQAIAGSKGIGKDDRLMDSNDQERERGITILAKNAALTYEGVKVNIVDTPGHADFGGEVERVLNMAWPTGLSKKCGPDEGPAPPSATGLACLGEWPLDTWLAYLASLLNLVRPYLTGLA